MDYYIPAKRCISRPSAIFHNEERTNLSRTLSKKNEIGPTISATVRAIETAASASIITPNIHRGSGSNLMNAFENDKPGVLQNITQRKRKVKRTKSRCTNICCNGLDFISTMAAQALDPGDSSLDNISMEISEELKTLQPDAINDYMKPEYAHVKLKICPSDTNILRTISRTQKGALSSYNNYEVPPKPNKVSNVKVAVRFRPCNYPDRKAHIFVDTVSHAVLVNPKNSNHYNIIPYADGNGFQYDYDNCFLPTTKQSEVFKTIAEPLIESAFNGFNVCLLAYGEIGSGKTYSMMGEDGRISVSQGAGVIPRFCQKVMERVEEGYENSITTKVQVSYYEVQNEMIYDLLSQSEEVRTSNARIPCQVRQDSKCNGSNIVGLTNCTVKSTIDLFKLLKLGNKRRAVADTKSNSRSSRSHTIFCMKIYQSFVAKAEDQVSEKYQVTLLKSEINLVDLSGSEQQSQNDNTTGTGESGNVDQSQSLITLRKVIRYFSDQDRSGRKVDKYEVPYGDSLLTWLLQDSFGGNCYTTILATLNSGVEQIEETMNTLQLMSDARKITNFIYANENTDKDKLIEELTERLEEMEARLHPKTEHQKGYLGPSYYNMVLEDELAVANARIQRLELVEKTMKESNKRLVDSHRYLSESISNIQKESDAMEADMCKMKEANKELEQKLLSEARSKRRMDMVAIVKDCCSLLKMVVSNTDDLKDYTESDLIILMKQQAMCNLDKFGSDFLEFINEMETSDLKTDQSDEDMINILKKARGFSSSLNLDFDFEPITKTNRQQKVVKYVKVKDNQDESSALLKQREFILEWYNLADSAERGMCSHYFWEYLNNLKWTDQNNHKVRKQFKNDEDTKCVNDSSESSIASDSLDSYSDSSCITDDSVSKQPPIDKALLKLVDQMSKKMGHVSMSRFMMEQEAKGKAERKLEKKKICAETSRKTSASTVTKDSKQSVTKRKKKFVKKDNDVCERLWVTDKEILENNPSDNDSTRSLIDESITRRKHYVHVIHYEKVDNSGKRSCENNKIHGEKEKDIVREEIGENDDSPISKADTDTRGVIENVAADYEEHSDSSEAEVSIDTNESGTVVSVKVKNDKTENNNDRLSSGENNLNNDSASQIAKEEHTEGSETNEEIEESKSSSLLCKGNYSMLDETNSNISSETEEMLKEINEYTIEDPQLHSYVDLEGVLENTRREHNISAETEEMMKEINEYTIEDPQLHSYVDLEGLLENTRRESLNLALESQKRCGEVCPQLEENDSDNTSESISIVEKEFDDCADIQHTRVLNPIDSDVAGNMETGILVQLNNRAGSTVSVSENKYMEEVSQRTLSESEDSTLDSYEVVNNIDLADPELPNELVNHMDTIKTNMDTLTSLCLGKTPDDVIQVVQMIEENLNNMKSDFKLLKPILRHPTQPKSVRFDD